MTAANGDAGRDDPASQRLTREIHVRLADLPRHLTALKEAMAGFGEDFGLEPFTAAFASEDPEELNRVKAVEQGFQQLFAYIAELAQLGLARTDLRGGKGGAFEKLRDAGVISKERCARLVRINEIRNDVAHFYVHAEAKDVHEGALLLVEEIGGFLADYRRWLTDLGLAEDRP